MEGANMKKITLLALILLSNMTLVEAREPAVEPVTGISIDDYKVIPPSQAKGYEFQKGKPSNVAQKAPVQKTTTTTNTTATTVTNIETKSTKQLQTDAPGWPTSLFLFVLIALPFGAWFGIMRSLQEDKTEDFVPSNTLAFPTREETTDDDDFNLPKAG